MTTRTGPQPLAHTLARAVLHSAPQAQDHPVAAAQLSSCIGQITETRTLRVEVDLQQLPVELPQDPAVTAAWSCWVELTLDEPSLLTHAALCLEHQGQTTTQALDPSGYLAQMAYHHATA